MTEALPELRDPTPQEQPGRRAPITPQGGAVIVASPTAVPDETNPASPIPPADPAAEKARNAANSRWAKEVDWEAIDIDEGYQLIAKLRATEEKGSLVLSRRASLIIVSKGKCYTCKKEIDVQAGRFAGMRTRHNYETGRDENAYACCAACYITLQRDFVHPVIQRTSQG